MNKEFESIILINYLLESFNWAGKEGRKNGY